jgi:hypothetical protein
MATWRADVFVNSRVGRITTEVQAATHQGAKEQIRAMHGNVQQIANLREVRNSGGSSSDFSIGDIGGGIGTIAFLILLFVIIEYWHLFVIGGAILLVLAIIGGIIYYFMND